MHDTAPDVAELVRQFHAGLTPEQRWQIASDMFEVARQIVESTLPEGLTPVERQRALIGRLHGEAAVPPPGAWENRRCPTRPDPD
ncbi:MAG: hypothetical protein FJ191_03675 [Gammaproteobacteria bacterium]|nr:hypothetical protein [Gammaproteobacteria bacterium]